MSAIYTELLPISLRFQAGMPEEKRSAVLLSDRVGMKAAKYIFGIGTTTIYRWKNQWLRGEL